MDNTVLESIFSPQFAFSVLRLTTPILFAALAALITDKAGIMNIGLEGIMLFCALTGVLGSAYTQSLLVGFICAAMTGIVITLIMAYFSLNLKVDIILAWRCGEPDGYRRHSIHPVFYLRGQERVIIPEQPCVSRG